jgi:VanZ family protein
MGLIFVMSAQPDSGEQSSWLLDVLLGPFAGRLAPEVYQALHLGLRKVAHFLEYAVLALLWSWTLGVAPVRLGVAWLLSTLYAASDEWHQSFVPGRGPAVGDVLVDSAGAFAMMTLLWFRIKRGNARQDA